MKVKITIKGKAGQAGTLAEALDSFFERRTESACKVPRKDTV